MQLKKLKDIFSIRKRLFTGKDAESITLSHRRGKPVRLGGSSGGDTYAGRALFKGEMKIRERMAAKRRRKEPEYKGFTYRGHRVAIKIFKEPITDAMAKRYRQVIKDFRKAGVRLPKMDMVKAPTERCPRVEWMLVSQLFGSTRKGSKIADTTGFGFNTLKQKKEAVAEFAKIANAGYAPYFDALEPFHDSSKGVFPIDIDWFAVMGKSKPKNITTLLKHKINELSLGEGDLIEELCQVVWENASFKLRKSLSQTEMFSSRFEPRILSSKLKKRS